MSLILIWVISKQIGIINAMSTSGAHPVLLCNVVLETSTIINQPPPLQPFAILWKLDHVPSNCIMVRMVKVRQHSSYTVYATSMSAPQLQRWRLWPTLDLDTDNFHFRSQETNSTAPYSFWTSDWSRHGMLCACYMGFTLFTPLQDPYIIIIEYTWYNYDLCPRLDGLVISARYSSSTLLAYSSCQLLAPELVSSQVEVLHICSHVWI